MKLIPMRLMSAATLALSTLGTHAAIAVYVSPDKIQSAESSGILGVTQEQIFTETFNSIPTGAFPGAAGSYVSPTIGVTYTSSGAGANIIANNQYGGYNEGRYMGVTQGGSVTMTIATPAQYFGFYFAAGDPNNRIDLYSGEELLLSFSTATLIDMLPSAPGNYITAINGDQYQTSDYYGQPVSGDNGNEPYAYLHFVADGILAFDKIVLSQKVDNSQVFENDNHSILTVAPTIPESLVLVPEPSALLISAVGMSGLFLRRKRR